MKYFTKVSVGLFFIVVLGINYGSTEDASDDKPEFEGYRQLRFSKVIAQTMLGVGGKFVPFFDAVLSLWEGVDKMVDFGNPDPQAEMDKKIDNLAKKINKMSSDIKYYYTDLDASLRKMSKTIGELYPKLKDVYHLVSKVERKFERMNKMFQFNLTHIHIENKLKQIRTDMPDILDEMVFNWAENRDYTSVLELLRDNDLKHGQICSKRAPIQQILYNHYRSVHGALVKGLWLLLIAHGMDKNLKLSEIQNGMQIELAAHYDLVDQITDLFRKYIVDAPRDMWRCDPANAVEGITYERFGRAFQKYLINMRNIRPLEGPDRDECPGSCEDIPTKRLYIRANESWQITSLRSDERPLYSTDKELQRLHMHAQPKEHDCHNGFLKNCKTIEEKWLLVCPARSNSIERYTYMKSDHWTYGSEQSCQGVPQNISRYSKVPAKYPPIYRYARHESIPQRCYYCMCTCEYNSPFLYSDIPEEQALYRSVETDRYIDLRAVIADEGHVITGVRLQKINKTRTFHLQIKQAKLLTSGHLGNPDWKDIKTYYPTELVSTDGNIHNVVGKYKEAVDYHTIKYNNTAISLDNELHPNKDQILTGVQFKVYDDNQSGKIQLRLVSKLSRFNFTSGEIKDYEWQPQMPYIMTDRDRLKMLDDMEELDLPTKSNGKNNVITSHGYVELVNSGLKVDVGQNVLPFIDIQPVDTNPPLALAGVGLYHRASRESGGYLGLNVTTLDLAIYLPTKDAIMRGYEHALKMPLNSNYTG